MLLTSQYSKAKGKQWLHHCAGLDTAKTNQANSQYNAKERVLTGCSLLACLTWEEGLLNTESMTALTGLLMANVCFCLYWATATSAELFVQQLYSLNKGAPHQCPGP